MNFAFLVSGVLIIIFISRADYASLTLARFLRRIKFNLSAMLLESFSFFFFPPPSFISGLRFRGFAFFFFFVSLLETRRLERLAIVISRYGYNDMLRVISL